MSHDLFEAARDAMKFAHAPYSKFPVGAAIRADDGRIYTGANIENAERAPGRKRERFRGDKLTNGVGRLRNVTRQ